MDHLLYGKILRAGALILLCSGVVAVTGCPKSTGGQSSTTKSGTAPDAGGKGRKPAVVTVEAAIAVDGELAADRNTAGVVAPEMQSQVATQVAGVVRKTPHLSGDWVKSGDLVVQLEDAQLRLTLSNTQSALESAKINLTIGRDNSSQAGPKLALQVQSAQSALDSAQKTYDSQKALFDLGGISASALDTARSQLETAQANLAGAKTSFEQNNRSDDQAVAQLKLAVAQAQNQVAQAALNLENASIRAPFSGQISAINVQPGMYVGLNTPAFTLVSAEKQITFNVAPTDTPAFRSDRAVQFTYEGTSWQLRLRQSPSAPINGVVPLAASMAGGMNLPFGAVGTISYSVPLSKGILIPLASIQTLEDKNYVFTIEGGKAVQKMVTIVAESGITAVASGLNAGDSVIVSPPPGLIPGTQVQPVEKGPGKQSATAEGKGSGDGKREQGKKRQGAASPAEAGKK